MGKSGDIREKESEEEMYPESDTAGLSELMPHWLVISALRITLQDNTNRQVPLKEYYPRMNANT